MYLWNLHLRTLYAWHPRLIKVFVLTTFCLSLLLTSTEATKAATTCVALVNNASWHVAAAWSCGVVPSMASGDVAEIPANITIVINQSAVVNNGTIKVIGELQVSNPQGGLQNNGPSRLKRLAFSITTTVRSITARVPPFKTTGRF